MRFPIWLLSPFLLVTSAVAHVVPNMTIEAEFTKGSQFTLKMNLDPRVFLSDQPTSLPPVSADWYLSQSETEKAATYAKATEYLKANVGLTFNDQTLPLPACEFVALDGATYEAVKPDTAETHLLATAKTDVPAGAESFKIAFGKGANVSLILLNSEEGNDERKPQVIFPGETSRPFKLTQTTKAVEAAPAVAPVSAKAEGIQVTDVKVTRVYPEFPKTLLFAGAGLFLLLGFGVLWLKRSRR
ncbi:hypothetical protein GCM10023213_43350 [Prosthecobacter algae]|uniref:Uncharacterized protein n=1 Tax=Prosthecobacter algae TaxID=1144682 RepID=A0ABP9PJZ8_9BACT